MLTNTPKTNRLAFPWRRRRPPKFAGGRCGSRRERGRRRRTLNRKAVSERGCARACAACAFLQLRVTQPARPKQAPTWNTSVGDVPPQLGVFLCPWRCPSCQGNNMDSIVQIGKRKKHIILSKKNAPLSRRKPCKANDPN